MKPNLYRYLFFALLAVFLIFSFATISQYGMTWDEAAQHHIGKTTLDYIKGKVPQLQFLREDLVYYGPFFEMANQYFGGSLYGSSRFGYVNAFHVLIILTAALGIYFLFRLVPLMFDEKIAFYSAVFLVLFAQFASHSQYNSKDIPLFAGFLAVLFFLYSGATKRKFKCFIWAGLFFGLTLAIRLDAIIVLPVFFGAYICHIISGPRRLLKNDIIYSLIFLSTSAITVFLAWPSLWRQPLLFFRSLSYFLNHQWPGAVLYFGKEYLAANLPWHYAPAYLLLTIPGLIIIFIIFGVISAIKDVKQKNNILAFSLVFFWIAGRLLMAMLPGAVRYDSIRHFLFIIPAFMILAALGFNWILQKMPRLAPPRRKTAKIIFVCAVFVWLFIEFSRAFPFGGSYFNEVARAALGPRLEKKFDLEYWGSSYRQGINWLNENAQENSSFCAPIADHLIQFYPLRADLSFSCGKTASYLMFFTRQTYLPKDLNEIFDYQRNEPIFKISRFNSDLLYIYKLDGT